MTNELRTEILIFYRHLSPQTIKENESAIVNGMNDKIKTEYLKSKLSLSKFIENIVNDHWKNRILSKYRYKPDCKL